MIRPSVCEPYGIEYTILELFVKVYETVVGSCSKTLKSSEVKLQCHDEKIELLETNIKTELEKNKIEFEERLKIYEDKIIKLESRNEQFREELNIAAKKRKKNNIIINGLDIDGKFYTLKQLEARRKNESGISGAVNESSEEVVNKIKDRNKPAARSDSNRRQRLFNENNK
ncbi:hypothetical protein HHI36_023448 [Cryptolaemus montrouzieri]|uniref:Uncharacterized protein n=1 Tax=Cryptolaemus montrouzieri TaxID=559131 RepID=A0ABD2PH25_9CUCU